MRRIWLLLLALLLASCSTPSLPRPLPFESPLPTPQHTIYFPLAATGGWRPGRGLAATYSGIAPCQDATQVKATWLYNWGAFPPTCTGLASLPMVWDRNPHACPKLGDGNPILLWNEPSNADQWGGNPLTPEEAVILTHNLTEVCYPGRTFATPAQYNPGGLAWMTAWWEGYVTRYGKSPRVMVMATHCYGSNANACIGALTENIAWAKARGLNVLVTEWGIPPKWAGSESIALQEADKLLHWLQQQPSIVGEAFFAGRIRGDEAWWFGGPVTALVDANGTLTTWGNWYKQH
jgi:hypothetical protein